MSSTFDPKIKAEVKTYSPSNNYDTLYSQTGAPMQNTEKNIFIISNKFWVPNLGFLRA